MQCPQCGSVLQQDMVDVGIGSVPVGPLGCYDCGWVATIPSTLPDPDEDDLARFDSDKG